jgi:hypothetical protein
MLLALASGCASSGEGGREIIITQGDEGCSPDVVDVVPGEKLKLTGKNETGKTYELEGTNGTQLEEILVPEGRTRSVGYTVPDDGGTYDVKCYQPGGVSTIVRLVAGDGGEAADEEGGEPLAVGGNEDIADETVAVELSDYAVSPDPAVVPPGNVEFTATNTSATNTHELAVLRVTDDGGRDVVGEIEDIPAGDAAAIRLRLDAGMYELACLIVPGEAGSTVDHYAEGMRAEFKVE